MITILIVVEQSKFKIKLKPQCIQAIAKKATTPNSYQD